MNQIVAAPVQTSGAPLTPRDMTSALALANTMCSAKLVPPHLQRSPGDCLLVIEQAMRWGMSPFAVAQCTSVIHGRLMFQGQLVSAALHTSGILSSRLSYDFKGQGNEREIIVVGTLRGETTPRSISIKLKDARTDNAMWTKQPDQQLVYFATRAWARRHAPEVMLGVYAPEDFPAAPVPDDFQGTTIDAPSMGEVINDSLPEHSAPPPKKPTSKEWLDNLERDLMNADADTARALVNSDVVQTAREKFRNGALTRLNAILEEAQKHLAPPTDEAESAPVDNYEWPDAGKEAA